MVRKLSIVAAFAATLAFPAVALAQHHDDHWDEHDGGHHVRHDRHHGHHDWDHGDRHWGGHHGGHHGHCWRWHFNSLGVGVLIAGLA